MPARKIGQANGCASRASEARPNGCKSAMCGHAGPITLGQRVVAIKQQDMNEIQAVTDFSKESQKFYPYKRLPTRRPGEQAKHQSASEKQIRGRRLKCRANQPITGQDAKRRGRNDAHKPEQNSDACRHSQARAAWREPAQPDREERSHRQTIRYKPTV